jgi:glutaminase
VLNPFNSLVQLEYENGIPRNPFINAGALLVVDVLLDHLADTSAEMLAFVRELRCSDVHYDSRLTESEKLTGYTNAALLNFMKGQANIRHEVNQVLNAIMLDKIAMPGTSGGGGGVVAVIPGKLSIAVWGPELNDNGNAVLGIKALQLLTTKTRLSIF